MPSELIVAIHARVQVAPVPTLTEGEVLEAEARLGFPKTKIHGRARQKRQHQSLPERAYKNQRHRLFPNHEQPGREKRQDHTSQAGGLGPILRIRPTPRPLVRSPVSKSWPRTPGICKSSASKRACSDSSTNRFGTPTSAAAAIRSRCPTTENSPAWASLGLFRLLNSFRSQLLQPRACRT